MSSPSSETFPTVRWKLTGETCAEKRARQCAQNENPMPVSWFPASAAVGARAPRTEKTRRERASCASNSAVANLRRRKCAQARRGRGASEAAGRHAGHHPLAIVRAAAGKDSVRQRVVGRHHSPPSIKSPRKATASGCSARVIASALPASNDT